MSSARGRSTRGDKLDRWSEITERGSNYRAEVLGGATTFLTMVDIVFRQSSRASPVFTAPVCSSTRCWPSPPWPGAVLSILMGVFVGVMMFSLVRDRR